MPAVTTDPAQRCPSVANVVDRADGGLARVKVPGGRITTDRLRALARAAARHASGPIEITGRANLQVRGVHDPVRLGADLADTGLSAGDPGDRRRSVMAPPLAGLDPGERADAGALVAPIVAALDADAALDDLSPKWGVTLDAGGRWSLAGRRDDVAVEATGAGTWWVRAVGGTCEVGASDVPAAVAAAARSSIGRPRRTVTVTAAAEAAARAATAAGRRAPEPPRTGPIGFGAGWWGAAPWLGRLDAPTATALADAASDAGAAEIRLTPWRGVVVATDRRLRVEGLGDDTADPATAAVACAGSTGCTSGLTDAPADAARLVAALRGEGSVLAFHVSGCAKRCAGSTPVARTFVAVAPGVYDVLDADGRTIAAGVPAGEVRP